MTRKDLAVDGLLALLAGALSLTILVGGGFGESPTDTRALDGAGVALALGSALPLVARRLAPLWVYLATSAATWALFALRYPLDVPVSPVIAVYTLGVVYGGAGAARRVPAVAAVAGFIPATMVVFAFGGYDVARLLVPEMLLWALFLAGVWLAGDRARLRRERIAELEERARRTAREAEHERRVAAAEERTRIARELHDSAGHAINVILMQAGAARLLHERDPAGSRRAIATVEQVARRTIDEIGTLVHVLREDTGEPPPADPAALEELVERHRADGLAVTARSLGPRRPLPHSVAWAAYRILQESLTNAARHGPGRAEVVVRYEPAALDITVTNPLAGPPAPGRPGPGGGNGTAGGGNGAVGDGGGPGGGHGIVGMRERATLLGGTLTAGPRDGTFRLHTRLPARTGSTGADTGPADAAAADAAAQDGAAEDGAADGGHAVDPGTAPGRTVAP